MPAENFVTTDLEFGLGTIGQAARISVNRSISSSERKMVGNLDEISDNLVTKIPQFPDGEIICSGIVTQVSNLYLPTE